MTKLLGLVFDNVIGRVAAGLLGFAALVSWFAWDQRSKGATNVIAEVNQSAGALARGAEDAARAADRPGAVERLRKHSCRDC